MAHSKQPSEGQKPGDQPDPRLWANLRAAREAVGLSQVAAAKRLRVTRQTVINWERAGGTNPSEARMEAAAQLYGVTARSLRYDDLAKADGTGLRIDGGPRADPQERRWVARFRAELTELDASDDEIEAAVDVVRSDPAMAFMKADREDATALDAMRWFGALLRREVSRRHSSGRAALSPEEVARELDEAELRGASHEELLDIFASYPVEDLAHVKELAAAISKGIDRRPRKGKKS